MSESDQDSDDLDLGTLNKPEEEYRAEVLSAGVQIWYGRNPLKHLKKDFFVELSKKKLAELRKAWDWDVTDVVKIYSINKETKIIKAWVEKYDPGSFGNIYELKKFKLEDFELKRVNPSRDAKLKKRKRQLFKF
tara:strand:+ start:280 stop:681 length:402 start_codon:yes stop_codon:yes gene_type:complete